MAGSLVQLKRKARGSARKPAGDACHECPLRRAVCVRPETNSDAKLIVVGEAPGANEVEQGRPFIGASGRVLEHALNRLGLTREQVHWTNAVLCEPPTSLKDFGRARKQCAERLREEIAESPAEVVVPVGAFGLQSTLRWPTRPAILRWRGSVVTTEAKIVMPTVHPAFVLRDPLWRPVLERDFARIYKVMHEGYVPPEGEDGVKTVIPGTPERVQANLEKLGETVAVDVETLGLRAYHTKMVTVAVSDGMRTVAIPWRKRLDGRGWYFGSRTKEVAGIITEQLKKRIMVTHNGPAFDHIVLTRHGIGFDRWEDTLLAHQTFASHMPQNLPHVASMYIDVPPWKYQREKTLQDLLRYNAQDVIYSKRTWDYMQNDLTDEAEVYRESKATAEVCRQMQMDGIRFDVRRAKHMSGHLEQRAKHKKRRARQLVNDLDLNIQSGKQLGRVLLERFKVPILAVSEKTSEPKFDVNVMRAYAAMNDDRLREFVNLVLDVRSLIKTKSTYIDRIKYDNSLRVHPSWQNYGACTGRWSCAGPNMMNLIKKQHDPSIEWGGVRSLWIPAPGCVFVIFDYKQVEMRVAAYWSGDPVMIAACESSDMHAANAELIFGDEFRNGDAKLRKILRDIAKQSGFAVAYMAEAETVYARILAEGLGLNIKLETVEAMLATLRKMFKVYYRAQARSFSRVMRSGVLRIPVSNRVRVFGFEPKATEVANTPIQGGAAGVMNKTVLRLVHHADRPPSRVVAQVHDSIVLEVAERHAEELSQLCTEVAQQPFQLGEHNPVFPIDLEIAHSLAGAA